MNPATRALALSTLIAITVIVPAFPASAQEEDEQKDSAWKDGMWRLELSGWSGLRSGRRSRTGDYGFTGSVTYEIPVKPRISAGIRTYPFFVYDQDDSGLDTVYAIGFGGDMRYYPSGEEHRRFFLELSTGVIIQDGRFNGNSGAINFLGEIGVGWKFENDWHVSLKLRHLSNAGLASHNAGVNNIGLAVGYTFSRRRN